MKKPTPPTIIECPCCRTDNQVVKPPFICMQCGVSIPHHFVSPVGRTAGKRRNLDQYDGTWV